MKIEILGPGCSRCRTTEQNVRDALQQLHTEAVVDHVYDPREYARRGVLSTPAVLIDGVIRVSGKIPSVDELKTWIQAVNESAYIHG
jgi:small redox-active disulfide protein 2